jgi:hypothetical protein
VARSLPPGQEPWQTFEVRVTKTRGRAEIYAVVKAGYVTGIVGSSAGLNPRPLWEGVIAMRSADTPFSREEAALAAQSALEKAFPTLF